MGRVGGGGERGVFEAAWASVDFAWRDALDGRGGRVLFSVRLFSGFTVRVRRSSQGDDLWFSTDGENWNEGTLSLAPEREGYRMVAYGGSLWVFGGIGADSDNSVWRSADGGDAAGDGDGGRFRHE